MVARFPCAALIALKVERTSRRNSARSESDYAPEYRGELSPLDDRGLFRLGGRLRLAIAAPALAAPACHARAR